MKFPDSPFGQLMHGADYNPEQWLDAPEILQEDLRLLRLSHCNVVSLGIFSWSLLEPREGEFCFDWLDAEFERLHANGQRVFLATPSGGKPHWMAKKYPEIRRHQLSGQHEHQSGRHNHCFTSPVYREKVRLINTHLARRYGGHPALALWHVSNEYGGSCHCELCLGAFRLWLKKRYGTLEKLNAVWWSHLWSHTYTDWDEVEYIDASNHGLGLDWLRFSTDQSLDFLQKEIEPLREFSPDVPVTTNMMGTYPDNNYWKWAPSLDVMSWNVYPDWHTRETEAEEARRTGWNHDIYRAMKGGAPFLLMETTPSQTNWQQVSTPKRPGLHRLMCLQVLAHGGEGALYFQFRKSRGGIEKFHGAIVGHDGTENTRVFREVSEVGRDFERLNEICGSRVQAEVALIYDWEVDWAIEGALGPRNRDKNYRETVQSWYRPFWERGLSVDVIDSTAPLDGYKLLVAPMLYLLRAGVAERITEWVKNGGVFVATYLSGIADESDLCFLGGFPGPLRELLGIWVEETDILQDHHTQSLVPSADFLPRTSYAAHHYSDVLHAQSAQVLATYGDQFYAGTPALTRNDFGAGRAFYVAARTDADFIEDFAAHLVDSCDLRRVLESQWPESVSVQARANQTHQWIFVLNFGDTPQTIALPDDKFHDVLRDKSAPSSLTLPVFGAAVLRREKPLQNEPLQT